jgi:uncharacterized protein (TIGR03084 family)
MMEELSKCNPKQRIPWFARPMGAKAFATARLMETWAHGLDCFDAVGVEPEDTDRLRHVALLAYMARSFAYQVNGIPCPTPPAPGAFSSFGSTVDRGRRECGQPDSGKASEFCRVAVRRRHWKDMNLEIEGVRPGVSWKSSRPTLASGTRE